jgi:hypothetical protein
LVADIHYAEWSAPIGRAASGATPPYPSQIELVRPQEDYRLKLNIRELRLNQPLKPNAFTLEKPAGVEEVELKEDPPAEEPQ